MKLTRKAFFISAYTFLFTLFFLITTPKSLLTTKPQFFFQDTSINERLHEQTIQDPNGQTVLLTRLFHNKPLFSLHNFFLGTIRTGDPVYFFSLGQHPYYDNNETAPLPFWQFPLFLVASIVVIMEWNKSYNKLLVLFLVAILFAGLFLPGFSLRFLPLVVMIQFITAIGLLALIQKLWLKK